MTEQEWTAAKLASYIDRYGKLDDRKLLLDINASIAAERERTKVAEDTMAWHLKEAADLRKQLAAERATMLDFAEKTGRQLAAEREKVKQGLECITTRSRLLDAATDERDKLREQLTAAVEGLHRLYVLRDVNCQEQAKRTYDAVLARIR